MLVLEACLVSITYILGYNIVLLLDWFFGLHSFIEEVVCEKDGDHNDCNNDPPVSAFSVVVSVPLGVEL